MINILNLSHRYDDKVLFNEVNFSIFKGEKIGLVGINGSGKSTLLRMIIGDSIHDSGEIKFIKNLKIGYLDQYLNIKDMTIREYLKTAFAHLYNVEDQINNINKQLDSVDPNDKKVNRLIQNLSDKYEFLDDNHFYEIDSQIERVASGLGISAFGLETSVNKLSGGQKSKVILAKIMLQKTDVLLLDEPTNFLDSEHIEWLKKELKDYKGTVVLISHDFSFLKEIVNRVASIENSKVIKYNMNFTDYLKEKKLRMEQQDKEHKSQQKKIKEMEGFISRNIARASTSGRAKSRRKALEKMDIIPPATKNTKPNFEFTYRKINSNIVLRVDDLLIGYDKPLLDKISLEIQNGDKIAIKGFNGIGKTTFLKTIAGILKPLDGSFTFANSIKISYFEQENKFINSKKTPLEYMLDNFHPMTEKQARSRLNISGLKNKRMVTKISALSGGEKAKITLSKICLRESNLLILDEPTNHLDQISKKSLMESMQKFKGSIIFVSHDDRFIDKVATKKINFEDLYN